eukprot:3096788-Pyramimonas_sp.AAC.1
MGEGEEEEEEEEGGGEEKEESRGGGGPWRREEEDEGDKGEASKAFWKTKHMASSWLPSEPPTLASWVNTPVIVLFIASAAHVWPAIATVSGRCFSRKSKRAWRESWAEAG